MTGAQIKLQFNTKDLSKEEHLQVNVGPPSNRNISHIYNISVEI